MAIIRHALSRPKRAIRSSATRPAYSANAKAPLWNLTSWIQPESRLSTRRALLMAARTPMTASSLARWLVTYSR